MTFARSESRLRNVHHWGKPRSGFVPFAYAKILIAVRPAWSPFFPQPFSILAPFFASFLALANGRTGPAKTAINFFSGRPGRRQTASQLIFHPSWAISTRLLSATGFPSAFIFSASEHVFAAAVITSSVLCRLRRRRHGQSNFNTVLSSPPR